MSKTIAVIAAHPDDEVLGCGGSIAKHIDAGDAVHVLILAEGATSRLAQRDRLAAQATFSALAASAQAAHAVLGSSSLAMRDFPDNRMDGVELLDVAKEVETFLAKIDANVIYTHFPGDLNIDHRIVSEAVQTACRPQPGIPPRQILFFEIPSSTEWRMTDAFAPNYYCDISATVDRKIASLACYSSEMRPWPHARSLEACEHLARWRGASVGVAAAEAFMVGRMVDAIFLT